MVRSKEVFQQFIARKGLKSTQQRGIILDEFLRCGSHVSTEELFLKIRKKHPHIGFATVYRTLKLFAEAGIAEERHFGDGQTRYELMQEEEHHDHLICTGCGAIIEFESLEIERLQEKVAREHDFLIRSHRLDLYGMCAACRK